MLHKSNLVVGYTTQEHLLVDLDSCSLFKACKIARMIQADYPDVGDCLVVKSSSNNFHLVFDDRLEWETIVRIIDVLAALNIVEKNYRDVRNFRRDLTLRVSEKRAVDGIRPVPEPVVMLFCRHSCDDSRCIEKYLNVLEAFNDHIDFVPMSTREVLITR